MNYIMYVMRYGATGCLRRFYFDLLAARENYQAPNNTITQPHVSTTHVLLPGNCDSASLLPIWRD
jgi:hypothetical protein